MTVRTCVYDNPAELRRELWQNGELVRWVSLAIVQASMQSGGEQLDHHLAQRGMDGPWKSGSLVGSPLAKEKYAEEAVPEPIGLHTLQKIPDVSCRTKPPVHPPEEASPPAAGRRLLSNGQPATLGTYRDTCARNLGENAPSTKYFDEKISKAIFGRDEEVLAPESQVVALIIHLEGKHL